MNDKKKYIEQLLNLFMQGNTNLEQEKELSRYFATASDVPEQWQNYKTMFAYFDKGMPLDVQIAMVKKQLPSRPRIVNTLWWLLEAAAAIAIAVTIFTICLKPVSVTSPTTPTKIIAKEHIIPVETDTVVDGQSIVPQVEMQDKKPVIAQEKATVKKKEVNEPASALDSVEMEREKGQMELAQQELMADRYIAEQEREEMMEEQNSSRAMYYHARHELKSQNNNDEPQFIQVVFK